MAKLKIKKKKNKQKKTKQHSIYKENLKHSQQNKSCCSKTNFYTRTLDQNKEKAAPDIQKLM